jgi:nucleoside diphosphate kinase
VLVGPTVERAARTLRLWARYSATDGGLISHAADVPAGDNIERTLVMLKPDNFRFPSLKPGSIIDVLSSSGLRIVGAKKFSMSVAQAVEFYGPVKAGLEERFEGIAGAHTAELLSREFGFAVPEDEARALCRRLGSRFAGAQFEMIVKFMTGYRPSECPAAEVNQPGREECLALVYQGVNAVTKIRTILGSTDPRKAEPGSVRREFGTDIMVNAAHASDSTASADRELGIVRIEDDPMQKLVEKYYGLTQA